MQTDTDTLKMKNLMLYDLLKSWSHYHVLYTDGWTFSSVGLACSDSGFFRVVDVDPVL
jgi:hypothetical protein